MKGTAWPFVVSLALSAAACAGSTPSADSAVDENSSADGSTTSGEEGSRDAKPEAKATPEPQFTDNMSVEEAIQAVPSGIERANIDQETLGKPLQDPALYEPCKPGSTRVKLRVAIWLGKAVGIDVAATPKNDKIASCIRGRIAEVTWEKKVKSLNTIEFQL